MFTANTPSNGSGIPIGSLTGYRVGALSNGDGITSGTVNNRGLHVVSPTAAAGAGGTVNNYAADIGVPSGSSAGTSNYGLRITGNGGASAANNYSIRNESTAPSYFAGTVLLGGVTFANLPASPATGMLATMTNSNTATWGATIAGGGANNVLARYNGSAWTVVGI